MNAMNGRFMTIKKKNADDFKRIIINNFYKKLLKRHD